MIQQNELITFLVGTGVVFFILINRHRIGTVPGARWLLISFCALFAGWTFTIVEGFFLPGFMNAVEHLCYAISSGAAAAWCWVVLVRGGGAL